MLGEKYALLAFLPLLLGAWWLWRGGLLIYGGIRFLWAPRGLGKVIAHYRARRVKKNVRISTRRETVRIPFLTTAVYTYTVKNKTYALRQKLYGFGKTAERPDYLATVYYLPRFPYIGYMDAIGGLNAIDVLLGGIWRLMGSLGCFLAAYAISLL